MTEGYETVVFDLDGTLVRLVVEWDAVAEDVAAALEARGVDPPESLWTMLERAEETGHGDTVEAIVAEYERAGAHRSERLPIADQIGEGPVGVCSLNCEAACRIALERHGLTDRVGAVVGRDSVDTRKPDPEPLLAAIRLLGGEPESTLFVGDSRRDEETAEAAGTAFRYATSFARERA